MLNDIADIELSSGASYIYRENGRRYIPIKFNVRGRDLSSAVSEARTKVGERIHLPAGYHLDWSGEFVALEQAKDRLAWMIPFSLLLIIVLLYGFFNNMRDSLVALWDIPFAACGGILALYVAGLNLSVSAAVGFISMSSICVINGILVLTSYNQFREDGLDRESAMMRVCKTRMSLLLTTSLSASVGLLPAAFSRGIGSQVQRPLATVVVGGVFLGSLLTLLLLPVVRVAMMPEQHRPEVGRA